MQTLVCLSTAQHTSLTVFDPTYRNLAGTHRVQRVPANEKRGRRHSSLVTIAWLEGDSIQLVDPDFDRSDVRVRVFRGSGAGGQHRNKVETCVELRHLPTGLVVVATEQRSKQQNLDVAWRRLTSAIAERHTAEWHDASNAERVASFGSGRSWTWTDWRDEVCGPGGVRGRMSKVLAGRLDPILG